MAERYAIYFTPTGPLAGFGARWLGWDVAAGRPVPQIAVAGLTLSDLTAKPRIYGFHATMKPPFVLAEGTDPAMLEADLARFCANTAPVALEGLRLADLRGFLALVPRDDSPALNALAARCVASFDAFRAPAGAEELARRRAAGLSARQEEKLQRWGYPYVEEDFHFHLTLTERLAEPERSKAMAALEGHLAPLSLAPFTIDSLTLVRSDTAGRFAELRRFALSGA